MVFPVPMTGLGTLVNAGAIVAGTAAGVLIKSGLPDRFRKTAMQGAGLASVFVGISGALQGILKAGQNGLLERVWLMEMVIYLVTGLTIRLKTPQTTKRN